MKNQSKFNSPFSYTPPTARNGNFLTAIIGTFYLAFNTFQYWRRKAAAVSPASAALEFVEIDRTVFLDLEGSDESPKPVIEITDS
ncbi:hypothetical protein BO224_02790, partial [Erysipelotrichaceae bacterium NYU-BL-E8]